MKLAIMQPYFLPYIGYWQIMNLVDKYVVYDDVNYIKGGRINRNSILVNGQAKFINILLKNASPYKKINEIELFHDSIYENKTLKTIQMNYGKAPFFSEVYELVVDIVRYNEDNLALYLLHSLEKICDYLKIKTDLVLSSSLDKDCTLKKEEKVYLICKKLNANEYFNSIGGKNLYSKEEFEKRGITLRFLKVNEDFQYKQFNDEFVPNLSILDVMMFNSVETVREILNCYEIV